MLISYYEICNVLYANEIHITGAFHVGAYECEEMDFYQILGLSPSNVVWIDAIPEKVEEARNKGMQNVFHALVTDKDDDENVFNISNNGQSSSVLELGTHLQEHPHIYYENQILLKSITIDTFFKRTNMDVSKYNFWNFDIQGAELMALKGARESIPYAKAIYLEVNEKELYKNCGLIHEIDEFLLQYHFKRVLTNITQYGWGDALYIIDKNR
jgi:FkbM family methyltransferase